MTVNVEVPPPTGWICPRCSRGCAPSVAFCPCVNQGTGTTVTPNTITIPTIPPAPFTVTAWNPTVQRSGPYERTVPDDAP